MAQDQGGRKDIDFIAEGQDYEVEYVARKYNISTEEVVKAIKEVGNTREKVYEFLDRRSGNNSD